MTGKVEWEIENSVIGICGHILEAWKLQSLLKERESVANSVREVPELRMRRRKKLEKE